MVHRTYPFGAARGEGATFEKIVLRRRRPEATANIVKKKMGQDGVQKNN